MSTAPFPDERVSMAYFFLKTFHIGAMTLWLTGLFLLPRLFIAKAVGDVGADARHLNAMGKTLYFHVMTPAGVATIGFGLALIGYGYEGAWLPLKLLLVAGLAAIHMYDGLLLLDLGSGRARHGAAFYRMLNGLPLLLLLGIAALTAAKPRVLFGIG